MRLSNADLIIAAAQGTTIQYRDKGWSQGWCDYNSPAEAIRDLISNPDEYEFRIKPKYAQRFMAVGANGDVGPARARPELARETVPGDYIKALLYVQFDTSEGLRLVSAELIDPTVSLADE